MEKECFPMFMDITGKKFQVFGAGEIAARRIEVLLRFGANIYIVSPEIHKDLEKFMPGREYPKEYTGRILEIRREKYRLGSVNEEMDYVLAATNDEEVNQTIYRECRHREMLVNVASDRKMCDFYFPAVVQTEDVTIGLTSGGRNHTKVREISQWLRENL